MATAKKSRPKKKIAPPGPAAAKTKVDEPKVEAKAKVEAAPPPPEPEPKPKVVASEVDAPKEVVATADAAPEKAPEPKRKARRTYLIHLVEGSSCNFRGRNFVAGRPHVTSDDRLFEALRYNGRFRVDVREGGTQ
jgi:hypothetical protein